MVVDWNGTTIFWGHGQEYSDSQSNCRILRRAMSQKGLDGLPWYFACLKTI